MMKIQNADEASFLLQANHDNGSSADDKLVSDKTLENVSTVEQLNLKESFFILLSVSFGTGVLVIPYTVRELGVCQFVFLLLVAAILLCVCSQLLSKSVYLLIADLETPNLLRDPYPSVGELACGNTLRKIVIFFLYITAISGCIGFVLLVATILKDLIHIGNFTHDNTIRVWSVIIVSCITPIMYLGTYSDLKIPTLVALITSSISFLSIIINCFLANVFYDIKPDHGVIDVYKKKGQALLSLGTLIFVSMGAAFSVPNILVISSNPRQLSRSVLATYIVLFFIYLFGGLVPYFTLGQYVLPSITSTFYEIMRIRKVGFLFRFLTMLIEVLMLTHLLMASLLVLNPVYLHMEEYLAVPHEMNLKRVLIRSTFMMTILLVCCIVPRFEFILNIGGGVPLTVIGIIVPLIIYGRLFDLKTYQKLILLLTLALSIAFTIGNLTFSIINL